MTGPVGSIIDHRPREPGREAPAGQHMLDSERLAIEVCKVRRLTGFDALGRHVDGKTRRAIPADAYLPSVTSRRKGQGTESGYYEKPIAQVVSKLGE